MNRIEVLGEHWVIRRDASEGAGRAGGPRCAVTRAGAVICVFVVQSEMGSNDFRPMVARSGDSGQTWSQGRPLWPDLAERWSILTAVSRAPDGDLFLFGSRTPIDQPGESFWCEQTQGLKQNELIWSRSHDDGRTWSAPKPTAVPTPGAAEAPSPLCVARSGRWVGCYSPYNTFDPDVAVDRRRVIAVVSDDRGATWAHTTMLRFEEPDSGAAMPWVIELADGRFLGAAWHMALQDGRDHPIAWAVSRDGISWGPTRSTGIMGQSIGLAAAPDGRVLMVYNQRKHGPPGVRLAIARPCETDFGLQCDQVVWQAQTPTRTGSTGDHDQWTDYAFGAPAVVPLPDGTLLATLWLSQPSGAGIKCVRLR